MVTSSEFENLVSSNVSLSKVDIGREQFSNDCTEFAKHLSHQPQNSVLANK